MISYKKKQNPTKKFQSEPSLNKELIFSELSLANTSYIRRINHRLNNIVFDFYSNSGQFVHFRKKIQFIENSKFGFGLRKKNCFRSSEIK